MRENETPARHGLHLSWPQFIGGSFALILAVAGATWAIRIDRLEQLKDRVATYELSEKWSLPKTLEQIRSASQHLDAQLRTLEDVRRSRIENVRLRGELIKSAEQQRVLVAQRDDFKTRVVECDKRIAALSPESEKITLVERQSKSFAGYEIVIGVIDVTAETVKLNINNQEKLLRAGGHVPVSLRGQPCRIFLDTIVYFESPEKAELTLVCPRTRRD